MWKRAQCLMRDISLDKNGKVSIVAVPTMYTSSQRRCNCAGRELDLKGRTLGHGCQVPRHLNDPVGTRSSELGPCSPNPQALVCAGSGFSQ